MRKIVLCLLLAACSSSFGASIMYRYHVISGIDGTYRVSAPSSGAVCNVEVVDGYGTYGPSSSTMDNFIQSYWDYPKSVFIDPPDLSKTTPPTGNWGPPGRRASGGEDFTGSNFIVGSYVTTTIDLYWYVNGAVNPTQDTDGDGIYDVNDLDSDGDGVPDALPSLDTNARVYITTDGGATLAASNTVYAITDTPKGVEVWPSRTALAAAKIHEHARNITWHCIVYDNTGEPLRDHAGRAVNFLVAPEWRKQSELYEETP